jgi:hypothetical protein
MQRRRKQKKQKLNSLLMLRKDPNAKPKKIAAANLQTASFAVARNDLRLVVQTICRRF